MSSLQPKKPFISDNWETLASFGDFVVGHPSRQNTPHLVWHEAFDLADAELE